MGKTNNQPTMYALFLLPLHLSNKFLGLSFVVATGLLNSIALLLKESNLKPVELKKSTSNGFTKLEGRRYVVTRLSVVREGLNFRY